ncbi:helicase DnaB [Fulvimarina endophytica]|uniref:DNA 5'-3' helicase n=1 Tax=Fulvimarina endophytica TaxID=2293836 RepID=A0A371XB49_9HYPH|nr:DnaB-like helicase N-terminal domain-containing protein [Fulvimarina endophytica]RFC66468.1 helicase DnaB [Fulvimarina endophytica]
MNAPVHNFADTGPLYREAPNNLEAEQAILGAMLINNEAVQSVPFLEPAHFFEPLHQDIFDGIRKMITGGRVATPITVKTFLPADHRVGNLTVAQYLARLAAEATSIINTADYGRAIYDLAIRRRLITIGEGIVNEAFDAPFDHDPALQISQAEEHLIELARGTISDDGDHDHVAMMDSVLDRIQSPRKASGGGVPVPLPEIADVLQEDRLGAGNLYGLLGASGEGKTSLMLQFIRTAAQAGHPVFLYSFDQRPEQVYLQMWSQECGISVAQIARHDAGGRRSLNDAEMEDLRAARDRMHPFDLKFRRVSNIKAAALCALAKRDVTTVRRRYEKRGESMPTPLIILDHVSAVTADDPRADAGSIASAVNRPCKGMAEELGAAWLSLNQRNGKGAGRKVPRPIAEDLYGGEASRMDYDAILYLYRPERWRDMALRTAVDAKEEADIMNRFMLRKSFRDPGENPEGMAEIGAVKVRYGDSNVSEFVEFEGRYTRYVSRRRQEAELF